jgi:sugar lactone lactonase YvrE
MLSRRALSPAGAIVLLAALAVPVSAQDAQIEIVAEGLVAPRGVTIAPDGSIYVAEAGSGGETCMPGPRGGDMCMGPSGGVTRVADGTSSRVIEGLPSAGAAPEFGGISSVAVNDDGSLVLVMNLGADPAVREGFPPELATSGWLVNAAADGTLTPWVDVAAFEAANDPDKDVGGLVDSNPYGIAPVEDGYVVADAGGNDLLHVAADGTVSVVAVFPPETHEFSAAALAAMGPPPEGEGAPAESGAPAASMAPESEAAASGAPAEDVMVPVPVQAVPTSVVVGPDGAYYVGQLTGAPFPVGGASVWRVVAGEEPTKYASGFTNIIGLDFAEDGTLYVAELVHEGLMSVFAGTGAPIGAVLSVPPGGGDPTVVATGEQLMALGGLAVGDDGAIYVSTGSLAPGGTLVKITPAA